MRSIKDLAATVNQPPGYIGWAIGVGLVPGPDLQPERRRYYSARQWQRAVRTFSPKPSAEFFTATALCRSLNISTHRFDVWRKRGRVPEPIATQGCREVWSEEQVDEIRTLVPELMKLSPHVPPPDGFFNQCSAAEELGVPRPTWQLWVAQGTIPRPSRTIDEYRYPVYSRNDLEKIRKQRAGYFQERK